jgi:hypothetical protein
MNESGEVRGPLRLIAANVVRWRRYGEGGQELRPGTKSFRGGDPCRCHECLTLTPE